MERYPGDNPEKCKLGMFENQYRNSKCLKTNIETANV